MRRNLLRKKNKPVPVVTGKIVDALGLCRYCKHIEKVDKLVDKLVEFTSIEYRIFCKKYKKPCHITRETMVSCRGFKKRRKEIISRIMNYLFS